MPLLPRTEVRGFRGAKIMGAGGLLRFPEKPPDKDAGKSLALRARALPTLQTFDVDSTKNLLSVCQAVIENSKELLAFVDGNRAIAKQAGIETIGIELSGILEGGGLDRILASLENSAIKERSAQITLEGLARLRRAETLLAEANNNISKYSGRWKGKVLEYEALSGDDQEKPKASSDLSLWIPFVALTAIAIIVVALLAESKKD